MGRLWCRASRRLGSPACDGAFSGTAIRIARSRPFALELPDPATKDRGYQVDFGQAELRDDVLGAVPVKGADRHAYATLDNAVAWADSKRLGPGRGLANFVHARLTEHLETGM